MWLKVILGLSLMIPSEQRLQRVGVPTGATAAAFTLIELLVVIAIIGILASIQLAALQGAKRQGLSVVCKNHLNQMGIALRMYVNDNGAYPYWGPGWGGGSKKWQESFQPYYQLAWTNTAYHCPAYYGAIEAGGDTVGSGPLGSYAYNLCGAMLWNQIDGSLVGNYTEPDSGLGLGEGGGPGRVGPGNGPKPAHKEAEIVAPSEMFAIMDTRAVFPYPLPSVLADYAQGDSYLSYTGSGFSGWDCVWCLPHIFQPSGLDDDFWVTNQNSQHLDVFNILCCDGRVSGVPRGSVFNPAKTAANWNVDHKSHPEFWTQDWPPP
jgi:prepilin-type N-terminal cleavage/methylation domain-containing protein